MAPSKEELQVATNSLRGEADVWDHQSGQLETIVAKTEGLRMDYLQSGLFAPLVTDYDSVVDQVTSRCKEGQQRMTEIASTLRNVATTYDQEESAKEHGLKNLY